MQKPTNRYALIVAGGSGTRMGSELPKQFIELAGVPILMRTLRQFAEADASIQLLLVLPEAQFSYWNDLIAHHRFDLAHRVVAGGSTRFQSVRNGLEAIESSEGLVAIHDGVRPFVTPDIIERSYQAAAQRGNAIVAVPLKDSIRFVDPAGQNQSRDRSRYQAVQTPQTFQLGLLKPAFSVEESPAFTDDASVFEHSKGRVHLIAGDYRNIKITTPEDLLIGESFLRNEHFWGSEK